MQPPVTAKISISLILYSLFLLFSHVSLYSDVTPTTQAKVQEPPKDTGFAINSLLAPTPSPTPINVAAEITEDENYTAGLKYALGASQLSNLSPSNNLSPRQILVNGYGNVSTAGGGSLAGGVGVSVGGGYHHYISIKQELWYIGRDVEIPDFPGAGLDQSTMFFRDVLEFPAIIELGWPGALGVKTLRPFVFGGLYGERLIDATRSRNLGTNQMTTTRWIGTPDWDWGYVMGVGIKYKIFRLEWRYEEGQNNLDPMGLQPVFARSSYIVFVLGE